MIVLCCDIFSIPFSDASSKQAGRSQSFNDHAIKHSASQLTTLLVDKEAEMERLRMELAEKDQLLDEMQDMLRDKALEADSLLGEAITVANDVCANSIYVQIAMR